MRATNWQLQEAKTHLSVLSVGEIRKGETCFARERMGSGVAEE